MLGKRVVGLFLGRVCVLLDLCRRHPRRAPHCSVEAQVFAGGKIQQEERQTLDIEHKGAGVAGVQVRAQAYRELLRTGPGARPGPHPHEAAVRPALSQLRARVLPVKIPQRTFLD